VLASAMTDEARAGEPGKTIREGGAVCVRPMVFVGGWAFAAHEWGGRCLFVVVCVVCVCVIERHNGDLRIEDSAGIVSQSVD
jgi:hypothetical protein